VVIPVMYTILDPDRAVQPAAAAAPAAVRDGDAPAGALQPS
jgi:hypothetical protein